MYRETTAATKRYRLEQLETTSHHVGAAASREAQLERQQSPGYKGTIYDPIALKRNAESELRTAATALERACGACALRDECQLSSNINRWRASHPVAGPNLATANGGETRKGMLSRIRKNPDAACEPSAINDYTGRGQMELL